MTNPSTTQLAQELAALTDATRRLCKLHGDLGLAYPKRAAPAALSGQATARQRPVSRQPLPSPAPVVPTQKTAAPAVAGPDIADLKETISRCERCGAEAKRLPPLFGTGREQRPALLIIGDTASPEGVAQGSTFPGPEGDLLAKMLGAINLSVDDVFQVNILRCTLEGSKLPLATQLSNCRPHLLEQITLFQPLLICTMGQVASQTLLATHNKLIALRGRFHQFQELPLMATYHPRQLLQVPDLKKAAWYDLQLIQHKLKQVQKS